jgi:hypothetical protein
MELLLAVCALFNVAMWLWLCSVAVFGILGTNKVRELVLADPDPFLSAAKPERANVEEEEKVRHIVVFPNYKEDEAMLRETLQSLSQAEGAEEMWVVLAMEEREGSQGAGKAERLLQEFKERFSDIFATYHPPDLYQDHTDGSSCPEVPGKASNLKWAVRKVYEKWNTSFPMSNAANVLLSVADADCLFHPSYFASVADEFNTMRLDFSLGGKGAVPQHRWTMWQAPQLCFRNYFISSAPARAWGYISSLYEFGGVSSISAGGHHMVFSAYSVNLQLAVDADMWDGDIIAEDHHAYLKGFLYSAYASIVEGDASFGCRPKLRVRPVMLPVKSTSVVSSDGYWASWVERWHQAKRHCQGVSELSYGFLATWDLLCTMPMRMYNLNFIMQLTKVVLRPFFIHILPICQALALGVLSFFWIVRNRMIPGCPDRIYMASADGETLLCGLAGAWALTWPVLIPFCLLATSNYLFIKTTFILPAEEKSRAGNMWYDCNGFDDEGHSGIWFRLLRALGSRMTLALLIPLDCIIAVGPLMVPYGLVAEILGCWSVLVKGNRFDYISAAKATSSAQRVQDYGTMSG